MNDTDSAAPPSRPGAGAVLRHIVDAAAPPFTFLLLNTPWGARRAALAALLVAVAIAALRRYRGEPLGMVIASTGFVALHSAGAIVMGEGKAFFLPELLINLAALLVCAGSLLAHRPITAVVCRKLGVTPADVPHDRRATRRHRALTAAWAAMWLLHLLPLAYLYSIDSVVGLTVLGTFFNKPTLLAMAAATVVVERRATRAPAPAAA
ncbi:DUF3159 domain-containing protein [Saccharopolyspora sp. NPDC047091]|uniref:DUF3159 domain-containing protein n=1 Tax=Saccharopolyspora sp. NPDC047091 TaxID=3155924 RepID=UPI0033CEA20E